MNRSVVALVVLLLGCVACGDSDPDLSTAVSSEPGAAVYFELDADLVTPARFYDFPFPAEVRLSASGTPDLRGFPYPATNRVVPPVLTIASERRGWPATAVANFRFDAALRQRSVFDVIPADASAPVLLIDIDPASPDRGRLFPTVATTPPADAYVPEHLLTVAAAPGIILPPGRTYAFIVQRSLGDAAGAPLGVPEAMVALSRGQVPPGSRAPAVAAMLRPAWETLDRIGIRRRDVAAATVFRTVDPVADLAALTDTALDRFMPEIDDLRLRPGDGVQPRFCELDGTLNLPQFQTGMPPYNGLGRFVYGDDGFPVVQRQETVPVVITVPRQPMPEEGYPLVLYAHGSGGLSRQVVDRGRTEVPGGSPRAGEGPAHVLAAHGFATVGIASPMNPERFPGGDSRSYLNLRNLAAYPDTFRQAAIDIRLALAALRRLRIDPVVLEGCDGITVPSGSTHFALREEPIYMQGQSLGAQHTMLLGAIEPRIAAVVPTGSGGLLSRVILAVEGEDNPATLVNTLLGTPAPLTYLHPGLQLVQLGFDPIEPIVFASRLAVDPLPGHPARSIYAPLGVDDPQFPNAIYDGMAVAYGAQQAGELLWPPLQTALAQARRAGIVDYPVFANQRSRDGRPFTGVVVQYAADGVLDAHHIAAQLDAVKYQYGCFLRSVDNGGPGTVWAARGLDDECGIAPLRRR